MKILFSLYLFIAILLTQFFSAYLFSKSRPLHRKAFSGLALCMGIYLFGYLMIINSGNLWEMIFWNQIQYLGLPFISTLWLIVALLYTKIIHPRKNRMMGLLFVMPVITFFVRLTNPWHYLFYTAWEAKQIFGYYALCMERGYWYYINIAYTMLCLFATIIIYYLGYRRDRVSHIRTQFLIFFSASLIPLIGIVLIIFTPNRWAVDYAALLMPVSLYIISYGILKYDFLEIKTLARQAIFEENSIGMVILEPGQRIIDYNRAAKNFFEALDILPDNYSIEQILSHRPELLEFLKVASAQDFSLVIDGEKHFFEIDSVPLNDSHDKNMRVLKSIRDVTEAKRIQEKLKILATVDSLSGLYNRAEFIELSQIEFSWSRRYNKELCLLMIDLDHFKIINDTFGHAAGDEVIRMVGNAIKTGFRKTDVAGRLGGDEFAVILKNTSLQEAKKVAEGFRNIISETKVIYEEQEISLTVSIGVASTFDVPSIDNNVDGIFRRADDALYQAKAEGRNRAV